jgi:hypothetical protein
MKIVDLFEGRSILLTDGKSDREVRVFVNPHKNFVRKLFGETKFGDLRAGDYKGDLYVWDGSLSEHMWVAYRIGNGSFDNYYSVSLTDEHQTYAGSMSRTQVDQFAEAIQNQIFVRSFGNILDYAKINPKLKKAVLEKLSSTAKAS